MWSQQIQADKLNRKNISFTEIQWFHLIHSYTAEGFSIMSYNFILVSTTNVL